MNLRCKFRHRRSIRRPRFPIIVQNFGEFGDVLRWFLHSIFWMSAIFLLPVCLTYWARKYATRVDPTSIIPTKFEVDMCIHCRVIPFLSADTWRDFVTLTLDLMSYNVSRWLPLRMRTRPLRMRRITWPVSRGSKTITYLESRPRFAYSLCNFYWATTTIKGRLLSSGPC